MCILYCFIYSIFNLQLSLFILTLRTPFHTMQTEIYFQRSIELAFFQIISFFFYNYCMAILLWITDYTYSYFIDSKISAFQFHISKIVTYLAITGILDAVFEVVLE